MPPRVTAIVVAAGRGLRYGGPLPKQWLSCAGKPLLCHTLEALAASGALSTITVVIHPDDADLYAAVVKKLTPSTAALLTAPTHGGATRQQSVRRGLEAQVLLEPEIVLIHDGARPFVSPELVVRAIDAAGRYGAAVPATPLTDTVKQIEAGQIIGSPDRARLRAVQTPQAFSFELALQSHRAAASVDLTDDAAVVAEVGHAVFVFDGDVDNFKVTTMRDLHEAEARLSLRGMETRVGQGYDVHAFAPGDAVWLGGLKIPHNRRLEGHSDADVVLHALADAIYGALGDGDIGAHFPPSDAKWRGAESHIFLAHAASRVRSRDGAIAHLDVTLICEEPKVGPHRAAMRARIAEIAGVTLDRVAVKATTSEGLGFTGRREGIACMALATVRLPAA